MKKKIFAAAVLFSFVVVTLVYFSAKLKNEQISKSQATGRLLSNNLDDLPEPKDIIIKFKNNTPRTKREQILNLYSLKEGKVDITEETSLVQADNTNVRDTVLRLNSEAEIEYAEPDYYRKLFFTPNDPMFSQQWWLAKIQAPQAWDVNKGSSNIYVAMVDSGISTTHPDFAGKIFKTKVVAGSSIFEPNDNHGTITSGVVAAATNNGVGISSSGFNTKIIMIRVADDAGMVSSSSVASAVRWAADNGAHIINMSMGGTEYSKTEDNAIKYAWSKGAVIIAAAGNTAKNELIYPSALENVFSVAATDTNDQKAFFSTYGTWVDAAAPGINILSTSYLPQSPQKDTYESVNGTSFSAPIVAGVAALIKSAFPSYTNAQIVNKLCTSSDKITGTGSNWSCGRINAFKAISRGTPTPPSQTTIPVITPGPNTLLLKLRFQGIDVESNGQTIGITLVQNSTSKALGRMAISSDAKGTYQLVINPTNLGIINGNFDLKIKGTSHLQRSFQNLVFSGGGQTIDLTKTQSQLIRAGDTTGDNKISIEDISKVSKYYTDFSVKISQDNPDMEASDVTKDGSITIQDLAMIAINWSDLTVEGDK